MATKAASKQPKKQKHVPLRTCISCRETKSKRELLRVVRTPDGHVLIDATGKKSGRGAYLCARSLMLGERDQEAPTRTGI